MRGKPYRFSDFSGGLNTRDSNYQIADNQARDCLNVISTPVGKVRKRDGCTQFSVSSAAGTYLYDCFAASSTVTNALLVTELSGGSYVFSTVSTAGAYTANIGAAGGSGFEWVNFPAIGGQGPAWGMNGVNTPRFWTGATTATAVGTWTANAGSNLPNGKYVKALNNRIFVAGMSAYTPFGGSALSDAGSSLVFSAIGDARTWPAANVVQFDPNDGDAITGLGTVGPYLLVFKRTKAWVVYDLDTGANRQLTNNIGCIAHRTIAESGPSISTEKGIYGCFFMTSDLTICVTDGQTIREVSQNIDPNIKALVDPGNYASGLNDFAAAAVHANRYVISGRSSSGSAHNTVTYDLDLRTGSWWKHDIGCAQYVRWRPSGVVGLYGVSRPHTATKDSVLLMFDSTATQDAGSEFHSYWSSPHYTWNMPYLRKRIREMRFDGNGNVDFYVSKNFTTTPVLWQTLLFNNDTSGLFGGSGTFGGGGTFGAAASNIVEGDVCTLGVARAFSFTLDSPANSSYAGTWELDSMTPSIFVRKT